MNVQQRFEQLVQEVVTETGSDLYILPDTDGYRIRFVAHGKLVDLTQLSPEEGNRLIRHIKFQSAMDISELRRPQMGRWQYLLGERCINCRISCVGDFLNRESVVVRFIYEAKDVELIWQNQAAVDKLRTAVKSSVGLILLSGSMGSGKTTTMYHVARELGLSKFILTIEDPVEIMEPDFLQLQVNDLADMSYATLLKLALRHHPDVMIIGEIRDAKTAKIVVEAALSGHLIISTVHATSLLGVWYRMRSFGIDEATLQQVLSGVGHQAMQTLANGGNAVALQFLDRPDIKQMLEVENVA
ncbi:MAG: Flp pilus assembly complex ATPase component TadA [Lactobacillaceae bacterium]|jgi:competence protein ComGA|nr:Flp pilus assembly complex ATPase component TadA [Lactobacillaceae bacterium]